MAGLSAWLNMAVACGRHEEQEQVSEEGLPKREWHSMGGDSQMCCGGCAANNACVGDVGRPAANMLWGSAQRA